MAGTKHRPHTPQVETARRRIAHWQRRLREALAAADAVAAPDNLPASSRRQLQLAARRIRMVRLAAREAQQ